ncbi:MAG: hypothetical protein JW786_09485 [Desulfobacterales bacterium]|nr:hypothetical protein [Desulfobacterales bacterium]
MGSLWVIWSAMLGSLFIYVIICHMFGDQIRGNHLGSGFSIELLKKILYGISVAELFIAYYVRNLMLSTRSKNRRLNLRSATVTGIKSPDEIKYMSAIIVSLAISGGIGIYGLVLFLLGAEFQTLYNFIAISAAAMVFFRPKSEEFKDYRQ